MVSNKNMKNKIFLISAPRSGSTLLQRVICSDSRISTVAEPWILLGLCSMFYGDQTKSKFNWKALQSALQDSSDKSSVDEIIKELSDCYYNRTFDVGSDISYILDKTPRYYWYIEEISTIFKDAKIIVLTRDPLEVYSSIINTWLKGTLNGIGDFIQDFLVHSHNVSDFVKDNDGRFLLVDYQYLVESPQNCTKKLNEYLGLSGILHEEIAPRPEGLMGDPSENSRLNLKKSESDINLTFIAYIFYKLLKKFIAKDYSKLYRKSKRKVVLSYSLSKNLIDFFFAFKGVIKYVVFSSRK